MNEKEKISENQRDSKKESSIPTASDILIIKEHIERDVKKEIKTWIWKPISMFLIIASFFGYTTYSGIKEVQNKLIANATDNFKKEIGILYAEKNVSKIVDEVIKDDAANMIEEKVNSEIDPIIKSLEEDQKKYARLTSLHELAINAQSGDRKAFEELRNIAESTNSEYSDFSNRVIYRVFEKYYDSMYRSKRFPKSVANKEVIKHLSGNAILSRRAAVDTIAERKMYDQVPYLLSMLKTEPNLDVLHAVHHTLDSFLNTKVRIFEENAVDKYTEAWNSKKDRLQRNR